MRTKGYFKSAMLVIAGLGLAQCVDSDLAMFEDDYQRKTGYQAEGIPTLFDYGGGNRTTTQQRVVPAGSAAVSEVDVGGTTVVTETGVIDTGL